MQSSHKIFLIAACALLLTGVQLGAIGSHALEGIVTPKKLVSWELAVQYQLVHSMGLIAIVLLYAKLDQPLLMRAAAWFMLIGICLFSGTIYMTALGAPAPLGIMTPFGGVSLMLAWLLLGIAVFRSKG